MSRPMFGALLLTAFVPIALMIWWQLGDNIAATPSDTDPERSAPAEQQGDAASTTPEAEREGLEPSETPTGDKTPKTIDTHPGSLLVRVLFSDNTPAAGIGIGLQLCPRYAARQSWIWTEADEKGELRMDEVDAYRVIVLTDRQPDDFKVAKIEPAQHTELVYVMKEGIHLQGLVVDRADVPVAGAEVLLCRWAGQRARSVTVSDATGRFELREVGKTVNVGARKAGFAPSPMRTIMASKGAAFEVKVRMPGMGGAVRGRVADLDGKGIEGAELKFGYLDFDGRVLTLPDGSRGMHPRSHFVVTNSDGSFAVHGLASGETAFQVRADEYVPIQDKVRVQAHVTTPISIQLTPGATCLGTVRDDKGNPVPRVNVWHGQSRRPTYRSTVTDQDGAFRLSGLPSGQIELRVDTGDRGNTKQEFDVRPGETFRWDARLTRGLVIAGRVTNDKGQRVEKPWFQCVGTAEDGKIWARRFVGDEEGKFEIIDIPPETSITVTVRAREHAPIIGKKVHTSTRRLDLQLKYEGKPTGRIIGKLLDPDGKPIANAQLSIHKKDDRSGSRGIHPAKKDGSILFEKLRPGIYRLRAEPGVFPTYLSDWFDLARDATHDLGKIRMPHGGRAHFDIPGLTGESPCTFQILKSDGRTFVGHVSRCKPPVRSRALLPGSYVVRTSGDQTVPMQKKFTVQEGETTRVPMSVRAGTPVEVRFAKIDFEDPPTRIEFVITGPDGFRHENYALRYSDGHYARKFGLPPGAFHLEATTTLGHRGTRDFTVAANNKPQRVETPLSR